jgi:hypothetical protein
MNRIHGIAFNERRRMRLEKIAELKKFFDKRGLQIS